MTSLFRSTLLGLGRAHSAPFSSPPMIVLQSARLNAYIPRPVPIRSFWSRGPKQGRGYASGNSLVLDSKVGAGSGSGSGSTSRSSSAGPRGGETRYTGPGVFRRWSTRLAILVALPTFYLLGAAFPPNLILLIYPRYSPPPPEAESTRGKALVSDCEREAQSLYVVHKMRRKEGWYETRPYKNFDPNKVHNSLTAGTLRGPGKLMIPPILFAKHDESEAVLVLHVGRALCGHDGIVHGGLIATIFDDSLARNALLNLPSHIGVTANLSINYLSPTQADQFVVVRTKLDEAKGRKVKVSATMETLDGEKLASATALFIEPKWAQFLQSSGVTEAMGRPLPTPRPESSLVGGGDVEKLV